MARPIPRLPPVTIAVGPGKSSGRPSSDVYASDAYAAIQNESQPRFRRDSDALALGHDFGSGPGRGSGSSTDSRAFSTTGDGAYDGADRGCSARHLRGPRSAGLALPLHALRVDVHHLTVYFERNQIQSELGAPGQLAGILGVH